MKISKHLLYISFLCLGCLVSAGCSDDSQDDNGQKITELSKTIAGMYPDTLDVAEDLEFSVETYNADGSMSSTLYMDMDGNNAVDIFKVEGTWKFLNNATALAKNDEYTVYALENTINYRKFAEDNQLEEFFGMEKGKEYMYCDTVLAMVMKDGAVQMITSSSLDAMDIESLDDVTTGKLLGASMAQGMGQKSWWDALKTAGEGILYACNAVRHAGATVLKLVASDVEEIVTAGKVIICGKESVLTAPNYSDWMSSIRDNIPVCHVSIPGTHDTFSQGITHIAGYWGKTQVFDVENLWSRGCRQYDIRLCFYPEKEGEKKLGLVHNFDWLECNITFMDAMRQIVQQLKKHKDETAIVVLKFDANKGSQQEAAECLKSALNSKELEDYIATWTPGITMQEARQRMIVISRVGLLQDDARIPYATGWDVNAQGAVLKTKNLETKLWVQDHYGMNGKETTAGFIEDKEAYFKDNLLDAEKDDEDKNVWTFNHTSAYSMVSLVNLVSVNLMNVGMCYSQIAYDTNQNAEFEINKLDGSHYIGIIPMDYYGSDFYFNGWNTHADKLPVTIINHNKKLTWHGYSFMK